MIKRRSRRKRQPEPDQCELEMVQITIKINRRTYRRLALLARSTFRSNADVVLDAIDAQLPIEEASLKRVGLAAGAFVKDGTGPGPPSPAFSGSPGQRLMNIIMPLRGKGRLH